MNEKEISERISEHTANTRARLQRLARYYRGEHDILLERKEDGKPNNRLVNNFCRAITDSTVGYFMGIPVTYTLDGDGGRRVAEISRYNDEAFCNSRLSRDLSVFGRAAELLWCDGDGEARFSPIDAASAIEVTDGSLDGELDAAIRYYSVRGTGRCEVYYPDRVEYYTREEGGALKKTDEREHFFLGVPINFYRNNADAEGDFESVISLVDAYNKLESECLNDFELFADSFLTISGMGGTDAEDIARLRRDRVLLLDEGGEARWLTKNVNDVYIENMKKRISADIYRFSGTPDMSEDSVFSSGASGTAIKYRLLAFDNRVRVTEQYFRRALMRRWELISNLLSVKGEGFAWQSLRPCFTKNLPGALESCAEVAEKLSGIVSDETLFSLMPFIDDPREESAKKSLAGEEVK